MARAKSYAECQSCGMPRARDEGGGGTEADGSKSPMYCSHCYDAGRFRLPDLTAADMQRRVEGRLKELGLPPAAIARSAQLIPTLARWVK